MDTIQNRISAFIELGKFLSQFSQKETAKKDNIQFNDLFFDGFKHQLKIAEERNTWFTKENLLFATESWSKALTKDNIQQWISKENIGNKLTWEKRW